MGAMGAIYTSRGPLTLPITVGVHCQPPLVGTLLPAYDLLPLHDWDKLPFGNLRQ